MTKQEKNYLEGKINNRLSSVKVQLDYQLKQYAKDGKHSYSFSSNEFHKLYLLLSLQLLQSNASIKAECITNFIDCLFSLFNILFLLPF